MDKSDIAMLAERIERLEQENACLKRLVALVVVGLAALTIVGTDLVRPAGPVEAESFIVKDRHGQVRATLGIHPEGGTGLRILDDRGRDQVALRAMTDRSSALEFRAGEKVRASLSSVGSGTARLNLFDDRNGIATSLYVQPDNEAGLAIQRRLGSLNLGLRPDGTPHARISDAEGNRSVGPILDVEGRLTCLKPLLDRDQRTPTPIRPTPLEPSVM